MSSGSPMGCGPNPCEWPCGSVTTPFICPLCDPGTQTQEIRISFPTIVGTSCPFSDLVVDVPRDPELGLSTCDYLYEVLNDPTYGSYAVWARYTRNFPNPNTINVVCRAVIPYSPPFQLDYYEWRYEESAPNNDETFDCSNPDPAWVLDYDNQAGDPTPFCNVPTGPVTIEPIVP